MTSICNDDAEVLLHWRTQSSLCSLRTAMSINEVMVLAEDTNNETSYQLIDMNFWRFLAWKDMAKYIHKILHGVLNLDCFMSAPV